MATGRLPDPNTAPVTAKGDLYTYSTVPAKLAVGNNGETLVADSSQTTGLRYNPQNALANPVINGGFDIWQRGTSISLAASTAAANGYNADRWCSGTNANQAITISRQTTGDTTNLPNIQYCARYQRNSGQTGTTQIYFGQTVETVNAIPYAGRTITISFYARKGANFSSFSTDVLSAQVFTGTGTDTNRNAGAFTGDANPISGNVTLTTTWQRFVVTGTLASNITQFAILFSYTPSGTAGANDYYEVTGVQVDLGTYTASSAPAFRRSGGTLAGELAACQRYTIKFGGEYAYTFYGVGFYQSATNANIFVPFPVKMRIAPTLTTPAASYFYYGTAGSNPTAIAINQASATAAQLACTVSGQTTNYATTLYGDSTTNSYLLFTSEL